MVSFKSVQKSFSGIEIRPHFFQIFQEFMLVLFVPKLLKSDLSNLLYHFVFIRYIIYYSDIYIQQIINFWLKFIISAENIIDFSPGHILANFEKNVVALYKFWLHLMQTSIMNKTS